MLCSFCVHLCQEIVVFCSQKCTEILIYFCSFHSFKLWVDNFPCVCIYHGIKSNLKEFQILLAESPIEFLPVESPI